MYRDSTDCTCKISKSYPESKGFPLFCNTATASVISENTDDTGIESSSLGASPTIPVHPTNRVQSCLTGSVPAPDQPPPVPPKALRCNPPLPPKIISDIPEFCNIHSLRHTQHSQSLQISPFNHPAVKSYTKNDLTTLTGMNVPPIGSITTPSCSSRAKKPNQYFPRRNLSTSPQGHSLCDTSSSLNRTASTEDSANRFKFSSLRKCSLPTCAPTDLSPVQSIAETPEGNVTARDIANTNLASSGKAKCKSGCGGLQWLSHTLARFLRTNNHQERGYIQETSGGEEQRAIGKSFWNPQSTLSDVTCSAALWRERSSSCYSVERSSGTMISHPSASKCPLSSPPQRSILGKTRGNLLSPACSPGKSRRFPRRTNRPLSSSPDNSKSEASTMQDEALDHAFCVTQSPTPASVHTNRIEMPNAQSSTVQLFNRPRSRWKFASRNKCNSHTTITSGTGHVHHHFHHVHHVHHFYHHHHHHPSTGSPSLHSATQTENIASCSCPVELDDAHFSCDCPDCPMDSTPPFTCCPFNSASFAPSLLAVDNCRTCALNDKSSRTTPTNSPIPPTSCATHTIGHSTRESAKQACSHRCYGTKQSSLNSVHDPARNSIGRSASASESTNKSLMECPSSLPSPSLLFTSAAPRTSTIVASGVTSLKADRLTDFSSVSTDRILRATSPSTRFQSTTSSESCSSRQRQLSLPRESCSPLANATLLTTTTTDPRYSSFQQSMLELRKMGWYWGPLSFRDAQVLLAKRPDGTFLVRDSGHDTYILSLSFRVRGETYHTRIEHTQGRFSFWSQPQSHSASTMVEFIEKAVAHSISGQFHYFLQSSAQGQPPVEVPLLYPLSRFQVVPSLRHLARFSILSCVRRDHIDQLPLPRVLMNYLMEKQCFVESLEAFEEAIRDRVPLEFRPTRPAVTNTTMESVIGEEHRASPIPSGRTNTNASVDSNTLHSTALRMTPQS